MADALQAGKQKLQELQIEVGSIGQNIAIVTKTVNSDLRDLNDIFNQMEAEITELRARIATLEKDAKAKIDKPIPKKKEKDFTDAEFKGEKE